MPPDQTLRDVLNEIATLRRLVGESVDGITRIARLLEQDDRLRERAERAEERERDERHDDLKERIEAIGVAMRNLPDTVLTTIEKKIYELRIARHEARLAGVSNEPGPLLPAPAYHDENTGQIHVERDRDHTKPFHIHHRDGERRDLREIVGGAVVWAAQKSWKVLAASGIGGSLVHLLHKLGWL